MSMRTGAECPRAPFVLEFFIKTSGLFLVVRGYYRVVQFDFHDAVPPFKKTSSIIVADNQLVSTGN